MSIVEPTGKRLENSVFATLDCLWILFALIVHIFDDLALGLIVYATFTDENKSENTVKINNKSLFCRWRLLDLYKNSAICYYRAMEKLCIYDLRFNTNLLYRNLIGRLRHVLGKKRPCIIITDWSVGLFSGHRCSSLNLQRFEIE